MNLHSVNPLLSAVFTWVWQTSLAASVLIGLVLLLQLLFRRLLPPRWRYALWLLVLLRLLMPVAPSSCFSVFNLGRTLHSSPAERSADLPTSSRTDRVAVPAIPQPNPVSKAGVGGETRAHADASAKPLLTRPGLVRALQLIWVLGAAGCFLAVLVQHYRMAAWLRREKPLDDPRVTSLLESAKATLGLRRGIAVVATTRHNTPALFGFFKPRLLLPEAMLARFDDQELRLVILHELVHLRRHHVLLNWIVILVQSFHWFNPAIWFAMKRLRMERELVCDAAVIAHLSVAERHSYGTALIKLMEHFSKPVLSPSLASIVHHQHQIERRITMIAQFKPTPRYITMASALLALALGALTFTGAADKDTLPKPAETSGQKPTPDREEELKRQRQIIAELKRHYEEIDQNFRKRLAEMDQIKERLRITDEEPRGLEAAPSPEADALRRLDTMRVEANAEYQQLLALYSTLTNLTPAQLRRALPTAAPDTQLATLLEQLATAEQKLVEKVEDYGGGGPEVKRARRVIEKINEQIQDRLDGILQGLKVRLSAQTAKIAALQKELDNAKTTTIKAAIERRSYDQAKRDLEALRLAREKLALRIIQEEVDAAIPKSR